VRPITLNESGHAEAGGPAGRPIQFEFITVPGIAPPTQEAVNLASALRERSASALQLNNP